MLFQISNPKIQHHQYAKMASFKILLVVALVAFIGSTGKKQKHLPIQYLFP